MKLHLGNEIKECIFKSMLFFLCGNVNYVLKIATLHT